MKQQKVLFKLFLCLYCIGVYLSAHNGKHTAGDAVGVLANNQLDALFRVFIYFISLHVSSITVLIIRRSNCINTPSGSLLTGIPSSHLHRLIIPDDVLIQFDLLMMSTVMLETCREMK